MKLYLGETIRRLRLAKEMTQEELADALGVSFQSVSRWESGTSYPDIELVPEIASYFAVTVDELMGLSSAFLNEKLTEAWRAFDDTEDSRKRLDLLREMNRNFPGEPDVIFRLADTMSDFPELYPEQKALTEKFLALPVQEKDFTGRRNDANCLIYDLFAAAPDEDLQSLLERYSTENLDMTRTALLNHRYFVREDWEGYEMTRQTKLEEILLEIFFERLRKNYHASASDSAWAQRKSLEILNLLTEYDGEPLVNPDPDLWFEEKIWLGFRLSCALASSDRKEKALSVLEDTTTLIENVAALPDGTKLTYACPSLDGKYCVISSLSEEETASLRDGQSIPLKHIRYYRNNTFTGEENSDISIHPLIQRDGWEWFDPIRDDPRYLACVERLRVLMK